MHEKLTSEKVSSSSRLIIPKAKKVGLKGKDMRDTLPRIDFMLHLICTTIYIPSLFSLKRKNRKSALFTAED